MLRKISRQSRGFSLVEIAVVLAITAFLIGAIVSGASLIHISKANGVLKEYRRILNSSGMFRVLTNQLPGDSNARHVIHAKTGVKVSLAGGKGNNDGKIAWGCAGSSNCNTMEAYNFFADLSLSGIYESSLVEKFAKSAGSLLGVDCSMNEMKHYFKHSKIFEEIYWYPSYVRDDMSNALFLHTINVSNDSPIAGSANANYGTSGGITCIADREDNHVFNQDNSVIPLHTLDMIEKKIDGDQNNKYDFGLFRYNSPTHAERTHFIMPL